MAQIMRHWGSMCQLNQHTEIFKRQLIEIRRQKTPVWNLCLVFKHFMLGINDFITNINFKTLAHAVKNPSYFSYPLHDLQTYFNISPSDNADGTICFIRQDNIQLTYKPFFETMS